MTSTVPTKLTVSTTDPFHTGGTSSSSSCTPFHLHQDAPTVPIQPWGTYRMRRPAALDGDDNDDDDSDDRTSATTINTQQEGIVVLDGGQPSPRNFLDWTSKQSGRVVTNVWFKRSALAWILLVSVTLGLRTIVHPYYDDDDNNNNRSSREWTAAVMSTIIHLAMIHFTVEIVLEMTYYQTKTLWMGWILLDLIVLPCSWFVSTNILILRAFRLIRALRLATGFLAIKVLVKTFLHAIPRIWSLLVIMLMHLYIFAVLFTGLVQEYDVLTQNNNNNENQQNNENQLNTMVASLGQTAWTLFQIMTGGRLWSDVSDPMMDIIPVMGLLFIPFVLLSIVIGVAFIVAIMSDSLYTIQNEQIWKSLENNNNNAIIKHSRNHHPQSATAPITQSISTATAIHASSGLWPRREGSITVSNDPVGDGGGTLTSLGSVTVSSQSLKRLELRIEELNVAVQQLIRMQGLSQATPSQQPEQLHHQRSA